MFEPATSITDFVLALVGLYCGFRTSGLHWRKFHPFHFHLGWSFYLISGAAFLGGIFHGFAGFLSPSILHFLWAATLQFATLSGVFLLLAFLSATVSPDSYRPLRWIPILAFFIFSLGIAISGDLKWVITFYGPVMVFVLVMTIYLYIRTEEGGMAVMASGIAVGLVGSAIWVVIRPRGTDIPLNAIYHITQSAVVWVVYRGAWSVPSIHNGRFGDTFPVDESEDGS